MKAGWEVKKLGEVCRIELGSTPARGNPKFWDKQKTTGNIWLSIRDLPLGTRAVVSESREYVSDLAASTMKVVPKGTLIVSFKLTLGRLAFAECDLRTNEAIAALHDIDASALEKHYLYWYLSFFDWNEAAKGDEKIKGKTLNKSKLREIQIPLPPLAEQKRIVSILDEAFEGLDRARENAEANLKSARELFEQSVSNLLSNEINEIKLKDVVTFHNGDRGKNYPNRNEYVAEGIPWLNTGQISPDGSLNPKKMIFIERAKFESLGGGKIKLNDLVFCLRGATIGKTAFVYPYEEGAIASSLMIIRPSQKVSEQYLYYFLTSDLGKAEIDRFIGGAAQPNLAGQSVGEFKIRLPSKDKQKEITAQLDAIKTTTAIIQTHYRTKLQDISDLRQSLLQKAFAGELT